MPDYLGYDNFHHDNPPERTGVLLVNLGTPEAPATGAVRRYLAEFLADPRVIELPRWLWLPVLHGIILRVRPARSAKAYRKIWTDEGSPLLVESRKQRTALDAALSATMEYPPVVALAMRYGEPSIVGALRELKDQGLRRLLVLPLYPQYSATTTGSIFDAVSAELARWRWIPELRFCTGYHDYPAYIDALAASIHSFRQTNGEAERLLFSFHGLPQRYLRSGDPYFCQCHKTARLTAAKLGLEEGEWAVSFQSRVGREEWLRPYTDELLTEWGRQRIASVQVVCPAFSADCLETLEEIALLNRGLFQDAGGGDYAYIPALNDRPDHIQALAELTISHLGAWATEPPRGEDAKRATKDRATALGANA